MNTELNKDPGQSAPITVGTRVRVRRERILLCGPRYPGRTGTVVAENEFGRSSGGLWYVRLDATKRARERTQTFFARELDILEEGRP